MYNLDFLTKCETWKNIKLPWKSPGISKWKVSGHPAKVIIETKKLKKINWIESLSSKLGYKKHAPWSLP